MSPRTAVRPLLAVILAANGLAMLFAPQPWYQLVPGVSGTGPLNVHFVRDIGCAYLCAGAAFGWLWRDPRGQLLLAVLAMALVYFAVRALAPEALRWLLFNYLVLALCGILLVLQPVPGRGAP